MHVMKFNQIGFQFKNVVDWFIMCSVFNSEMWLIGPSYAHFFNAEMWLMGHHMQDIGNQGPFKRVDLKYFTSEKTIK